MTTSHSHGGGAQGEAVIQVVQFTLGEDRYCLAIDRVAELVHMGEVTTIPNADEHVEGVMDLRGTTTTIVDPKVVLGIETAGERRRVIVLADEHGRQSDVGWVVDEVQEVHAVPVSDVDTASADRGDEVLGIVDDDDEFEIWLDPDEINR